MNLFVFVFVNQSVIVFVNLFVFVFVKWSVVVCESLSVSVLVFVTVKYLCCSCCVWLVLVFVR